MKRYDGHAHELLSEIDKEVVMAGIKYSIDAHLSALVKETLR